MPAAAAELAHLVERRFFQLTDKNIRRDSFLSVPDLIASIEDCLRVNAGRLISSRDPFSLWSNRKRPELRQYE
ncbi:hypothetical protein BH24ACT26_BH24ACT26_06800 [soil metagenome]